MGYRYGFPFLWSIFWDLKLQDNNPVYWVLKRSNVLFYILQNKVAETLYIVFFACYEFT